MIYIIGGLNNTRGKRLFPNLNTNYRKTEIIFSIEICYQLLGTLAGNSKRPCSNQWVPTDIYQLEVNKVNFITLARSDGEISSLSYLFALPVILK